MKKYMILSLMVLSISAFAEKIDIDIETEVINEQSAAPASPAPSQSADDLLKEIGRQKIQDDRAKLDSLLGEEEVSRSSGPSFSNIQSFF